MKGRHPRRHLAEYLLYRGVSGAILGLPYGVARGLGLGLGELFYLLAARRRGIALANLAQVFPHLDATARRRLARACFRHFGASFADTLFYSRLDPVELCRRLTFDGWHHLQEAEALGRGLFVLSAHLGNWEVAAYPVGLYMGPLHVVARQADNPRLEAEIRRLRERFGNLTIHKDGAARRMLQTVRQGGRVAILIDQRIRPSAGIQVPFFGRPAWTSNLLAALSLRTGAPVVPVFGLPRPGGRFEVALRPMILAQGEGEEEVPALTRRYLEVIEAEILRQPELWAWMHDRWRQR